MTKIISLKQLLATRDTLFSNKTSVLATGIFDLLHSEHKKFLKAAKKQGDILLVGLESDFRVRQLKGSSRPINPIDIRLKNLAQWGIADYLFPLSEKFSAPQDHQQLISQLKPDILAVSSHTPNLHAKKKIIEHYGGKIQIVLPHNPKISTSQLINS